MILIAVIDDLVLLRRRTTKAINITLAAAATSVQANPGDDEGETVYTLTPAQRAAMLATRAAVIAEIKALAAGLP